MLDVYKITSVLEKLPDAALQQYASMHKQDPYVLSLAVEESNRRKRLRAAPQGEPQQGQPAPVNEQAVQSMAPEDTGIAQLPAGNMDFADGGIVAFADAGSVGDADAALITREQDEMGRGLRTSFSPEAQAALARSQAPQTQARDDYMLREQNLLRARGRQAATMGGSAFGPMQSEQPPPARPATPAEAAALSGETMRAMRSTPITSTPGAAPTPTEKQTPRINVNGATPPPRPSAGLDAAARTRESTSVRAPIGPRPELLEQFRQYQAQTRSGTIPGTQEREDMRKEALAGLKAAEEELQARMPKGKAYERREAELKKEEEGVPAKKEENIKMALINAGLGMMAGTSPFAAVNIGEGAKQGMKTYSEGLDKLEKAAEKRRELATVIEEARRAEERGDAKDAYARKREAAGLTMEMRKAQIDAIMTTYKVDRETALKLLEAGVRLEIAEASENRADARAAMASAAQDKSLDKQAIISEQRLLDTELSKVAAEIKNLTSSPVRTPQMTAELQRARESYDYLIKRRDQLSGILRSQIKGMPEMPERPGAGGGGKYMDFDAKGNLITTP